MRVSGKPGTPFERIILTDPPTSAPLEDVGKMWETNVFGIVAVTRAMLPFLRAAPAAG